MLEYIFKMGRLARSEVEQCKQAFLLRDVEVAEDLVRQDEEINRLNRCVFSRAVEIGTDADRREWAMSMMLVARAIERIGDNAVDIGEQVAFVAHTGAVADGAVVAEPAPEGADATETTDAVTEEGATAAPVAPTIGGRQQVDFTIQVTAADMAQATAFLDALRSGRCARSRHQAEGIHRF